MRFEVFASRRHMRRPGSSAPCYPPRRACGNQASGDGLIRVVAAEDLLRLHSLYGPSDRSVAQGDCPSARAIARKISGSAVNKSSEENDAGA